MLNTKIKPKKCVVCGDIYQPLKPLTKCCSYQCALKYAKETQAKTILKERNKVKKLGLEKLKTKSDWLKDVQIVFNRYIRLRDKDQPCISCRTTAKVKYDAGHFYSVGAYPNLRFNEDNVHKQCSNNCNVHLSGHIHKYRTWLINKIGEQRFNKLIELKNIKAHYSIEDLKELKEIYKEKIKSL